MTLAGADKRSGNAGFAFAFAIAFACALVLTAALTAPAKAWAYFNDVTDSYSATQDVSISGPVLTGADIPEGTYKISATSSSYMCKFSGVTLTSAGGQLYATFTISKAYNALFFGTAEQAAASTNKDGTDYSNYYVSEPLEGYVARQFSLPIPALNQGITLATYSGGSKGLKEGMWYTRTVVFESSKEVTAAIEAAKNPQPEPEPEPEPEPSKSAASEPAAPSDSAASPDSSDAADKKSGKAADKDDGDDKSKSSEGASKSSEAASPRTGDYYGPARDNSENTSQQNNNDNQSNNNDSNSQSEEPEEEESEEAASPEEEEAALRAAAAAKGGKVGVSVRFVELDEVQLAAPEIQEIQQLTPEEVEEAENNTLIVAVAILLVDLVLAGVIILVVRQVRPRTKPLV